MTAPRVLAVMVAYNEADIIGACLSALAEQGCDAYLIDHGSTDGTADIARAFLGRGLVGIERFPEDSGFPARNAQEMVWVDLLRRREQIVGELDYDWYVLNDADEFRESPWPGLTFAEGLGRA
jgi:glycosyltransferase involved in cell wall biosynthesis